MDEIKIKNHDLKILPLYFEDVCYGNKTFELRKNDRDYKVGDTIRLREYTPSELIEYTPFASEYTGRECNRTITYILRDCEKYGLKKGFVILGIK